MNRVLIRNFMIKGAKPLNGFGGCNFVAKGARNYSIVTGRNILNKKRICNTSRVASIFQYDDIRKSYCTTTKDGEFNEEELKKKLPPLAPKALKDLVKLELFQDRTDDEIETIWTQYHSERKDAVGAVISASKWEKMKENAETCPTFIYPINKGNGAFFVLFSQWKIGEVEATNDANCLMTYLEDYRKEGENALPYVYVAVYPELLKQDKKVVLLRAEFQPYLTKQETEGLLRQVLEFYSEEKFQHVQNFNQFPEKFDFYSVFDNLK